jgi:hypothetical protein
MMDGKERCGAKTRQGTPCQNYALANGRCRMHGGTSPGRPMIHGMYSLAHRQSLATKLEQFLDNPHPGDLTTELALSRAILQEYLERFPDPEPLQPESMGHILTMVDHIARLVERISRILNQTALTQAEVQYLRVRFQDIMSRYIDDPDKRLRCLDEIRGTFSLPGAHPAPGETAD